jgi:linoleoyl-CoA desaturase
MPKITFSNKSNDFYQSLKTAVDEYFVNKGVKKTGDWRLYIKTFILVGTAAATYFTIMSLFQYGQCTAFVHY